MTDFELGLCRSLTERSLERCESILEDLQAMDVSEPVPHDVRHLLSMVIHDLGSVQKLVRRHVATPEVAEPPG